MILVPNKFPRLEPTTYRLAVIGDAPGTDEELATTQDGRPDPQPFVGSSGKLLRGVLASLGLVNDQVFFGHISQFKVEDIEKVDWEGPEIQGGISALSRDLAQFRPNCVLLLGRAAFRAFRPDLCYPGKKNEYVIPLGNWRGSIFQATAIGSYKCVATFHPSYIFRSPRDSAYFRFDLNRAKRQSMFPELHGTNRVGILTPTLQQVLEFINNIRTNRIHAAFDIEGYADDLGITMISICPTPTSGLVIPFWIGQNYWSEEDELLVWQALAGWLADPECPKDAHQSFYELFVLAWRHKLLIRGIVNDTMIKGWEIQPELERSLAVNTSFYTEEPYYKDERVSSDISTKLNYNFKDSAVTREIADQQETILRADEARYNHYRFNINLIPTVTYVMLRGCKFDVLKAEQLRAEAQAEVDKLTETISHAVGREFNAKSTDDKAWLLYELLGLEPTKRHGRTTKEDVLLYYYAKTKNPLIRLVIQCVRKRTRVSDIGKLVPYLDNRIRSSYDLVGTDTGRISSKASQALRVVYSKTGVPSWEETGTNLQNVTKDLRVCFIPDSEEYDFWQFDLAGADAWTVAADLAALGHGAMLDDLRAGIKPSLVLLAMLAEYEAGRDASKINYLSRAELKAVTKAIKADFDAHAGVKLPDGRDYDWRYLCAKRIQHGSNYDMRPAKLSETIFGDSDGVIDLSEREAGLYQYFYKLRYKTDARNDWIRTQLGIYGKLRAACGIVRTFHGIRNRRDIDDSTVREASAFEPQANTTWSTNMALWRLGNDPQNRTSKSTFFIEPLLHIHDALAGQYKSSNRQWAGEKIREWFNNPLVIHGINVTIPADGAYGPNWKDCKHQYGN